MKKHLKIGQVADIVGVSSETLRRWDKTGKFISKRHPINNYRIYSEEQVQCLVKEMEQKYLFDASRSKLQPYFETQQGQLYNADAVEFLGSLDTSSAQLIFADPPYNIKKAEWDTFESQKAYVEWSMLWIKEAYRILDSKGSLYICGFSEILADIKWAASNLFKGCKWLIWYYRNKANLTSDWGRSHESILHFRKSSHFIFNVDEVRVPYNAHTLKYPNHPQAKTSQYGNGKSYEWRPHPGGAKPKDVFEIPTLTNNSWEREDHPTQKPIELVKKCILASSNRGDLVIDPFGGSGTTFAVAEAFGREWQGSEKSVEYCDIIVDRLNDTEHLDRISASDDEAEVLQRRKRLRG